MGDRGNSRRLALHGNQNFNGEKIGTQNPTGSLQAHLVRHLPRRTWAAFGGTYYFVGRTSIDGVEQANYQRNMRLGATFGIVISRRQSLRVSYFKGTITRIGTDIGSFGLAYNVIWLKGR